MNSPLIGRVQTSAACLTESSGRGHISVRQAHAEHRATTILPIGGAQRAAMVRMLAGFGGFLNRKGDGFPGPQTLWIGLQHGRDFALAIATSKALE